MSDISILSREDLREVLKPLIIEALAEFQGGTSPSIEVPLLTREVAANILDISLPTLNQWEKDGSIPKPKRIGKRVYFLRKTFMEFLEDSS
jgi:predicted DNA-binding transcriptional regulator AlpA